jgi:hypothetical protein
MARKKIIKNTNPQNPPSPRPISVDAMDGRLGTIPTEFGKQDQLIIQLLAYTVRSTSTRLSTVHSALEAEYQHK